jgi:hypothetical protein
MSDTAFRLLSVVTPDGSGASASCRSASTRAAARASVTVSSFVAMRPVIASLIVIVAVIDAVGRHGPGVDASNPPR